MSEYFGAHRIAARMGVSETTILKWRLRHNFLMYRRRVGPRTYWYTNDALIRAWEISMCSEQLRRDQNRMSGERTSNPPKPKAR